MTRRRSTPIVWSIFAVEADIEPVRCMTAATDPNNFQDIDGDGDNDVERADVADTLDAEFFSGKQRWSVELQVSTPNYEMPRALALETGNDF